MLEESTGEDAHVTSFRDSKVCRCHGSLQHDSVCWYIMEMCVCVNGEGGIILICVSNVYFMYLDMAACVLHLWLDVLWAYIFKMKSCSCMAAKTLELNVERGLCPMLPESTGEDAHVTRSEDSEVYRWHGSLQLTGLLELGSITMIGGT